jgi:hypothetical protein
VKDWTINLGRAGGNDVHLDPWKLLESRLLACGSSGCGKSWMLRLIAEQVAPRIPTFILDPEGEYATLREAVDVVLVSADGEVRPTVAAAPAIARKLLEMGTSAVVALDDLRPADRQLFVRGFIDGLMDAPRSAWRPLLVLLDESHRFAPERGDSPAGPAVAALLSQGRKRGYGTVLATQRLSKLHKDAAAECGNVLVGRTTLDIDVARARDLLGLRSKDEAQALRSLAPGQWRAIGPALGPDEIGVLKAGPVKTTHPRPGLRHTLRPPEPSANLRKKLTELADLADASKGEILTLEQAQAYIAELEASRGPSREALAEAEARGRAAQRDADAARLDSIFVELNRRLGEVAGAASDCSTWAASLPVVLSPAPTPAPAAPRPATKARPEPAPRAPTEPHESESSDGIGRGGLRRIMVALAQHQPDGCDRSQLALLSEIAISGGTFRTYLGRACTHGWVDKQGKRLRITAEGLDALGTFPPMPSGAALVEHWLSWCGGGGQRRMLEETLRAGPAGIDPDVLAVRAKVERAGGSFRTYLGRLRTAGLVEGKNPIKASDVLLKARARG